MLRDEPFTLESLRVEKVVQPGQGSAVLRDAHTVYGVPTFSGYSIHGSHVHHTTDKSLFVFEVWE